MKTLNTTLAVLAVLLLAAPAARSEDKTTMDQNAMISVDFPDESRVTVLRSIAELYQLGLNLPAAMPDGRVSLKLRGVTWRQLFREALAGTGYTFVEHDRVVRIVKEDDPHTTAERIQMFLIGENLRNRQIIARLANPAAPPLSAESRRALTDYATDPQQPAESLLTQMAEAAPEQAWDTSNDVVRRLVGTWHYEETEGGMPCRSVSTFHRDGALNEEIQLTDPRFDHPIQILLHGFWTLDAGNTTIRTLITSSTKPHYFKAGRARQLRIVSLEPELLNYRIDDGKTVIQATRGSAK